MLTSINVNTAASGPIGITDINGKYTYYTTLISAATASVTGDTIVFFTNIVETNNVTVILPDGVDINLNGFSYTLDNAGTASAIEFANGGTNAIYNGEVIRLNGSDNDTDSSALRIDLNTAYLHGVVVRNATGVGIYLVDGTLNGSWEVRALRGVYSSSSTMDNGTIRTTTFGVVTVNDTTLIDCFIFANSEAIFGSGGTITVDKCTIYSTGGGGIIMNTIVPTGGITASNTYIASTVGQCIRGGVGTVALKNVTMISFTSNAVSVPLGNTNGVDITHCSANTLTSTVFNIVSSGTIYLMYNKLFVSSASGVTGISVRGTNGLGNTIDTSFNSILVASTNIVSPSHGITVQSATGNDIHVVKQNDIRLAVGVVTSYCLNGAAGVIAYFAGNMLQTNTGGSPVAPTLAQAMVATPDLYGNTQII